MLASTGIDYFSDCTVNRSEAPKPSSCWVFLHVDPSIGLANFIFRWLVGGEELKFSGSGELAVEADGEEQLLADIVGEIYSTVG